MFINAYFFFGRIRPWHSKLVEFGHPIPSISIKTILPSELNYQIEILVALSNEEHI